ncbi:hypothetical protein ACKI1Q_45980, partial [Streptomyces galilaeus]|uniref:hypothetical protein n=1 Tax=Streptomyces galilaeus TaxID=33899 RepID=UPI0038F81A87
FRKMSGYGFGRFSSLRAGLDKGHKTQFKRLVENIKTSGQPLIPFEDIVNTTKASFAALESLRTSSWVQIP